MEEEEEEEEEEKEEEEEDEEEEKYIEPLNLIAFCRKQLSFFAGAVFCRVRHLPPPPPLYLPCPLSHRPLPPVLI